MRLLGAWLHDRRREVLVWALFCGVFAAVFALYRLPLAAVGYPCALCALLGAGFAVADMRRLRRRHEALQALRGRAAAEWEGLPAPATLPEADYQALLASLREAVMAADAAAAARFADAAEYSTVWVHQIKTPITAMNLALQSEDSPLARSLSRDLFAIERYVEMALAFVRLEAPAGDYVFRSCELDAVLRRSCARFAQEFIGRGLRLDLVPTCQTVVTDEKWLGLIIDQLLSNALKYTFAGGIRIASPSPLTLQVSDSGIGICEADLPRVFEKGFTGANGRLQGQASGLGLYLCRRVCDRLGIRLTIASKVGQGTVVTLQFSAYDAGRE